MVAVAAPASRQPRNAVMRKANGCALLHRILMTVGAAHFAAAENTKA
jgi:hypothetical protein